MEFEKKGSRPPPPSPPAIIEKSDRLLPDHTLCNDRPSFLLLHVRRLLHLEVMVFQSLSGDGGLVSDDGGPDAFPSSPIPFDCSIVPSSSPLIDGDDVGGGCPWL
jgi:hypothetical protein